MSAVRRSMVRMFQHLKVYPFITPRTEGGCMKAEDRLKQRCREFSSYFPRLSACISSNMLTTTASHEASSKRDVQSHGHVLASLVDYDGGSAPEVDDGGACISLSQRVSVHSENEFEARGHFVALRAALLLCLQLVNNDVHDSLALMIAVAQVGTVFYKNLGAAAMASDSGRKQRRLAPCAADVWAGTSSEKYNEDLQFTERAICVVGLADHRPTEVNGFSIIFMLASSDFGADGFGQTRKRKQMTSHPGNKETSEAEVVLRVDVESFVDVLPHLFDSALSTGVEKKRPCRPSNKSLLSIPLWMELLVDALVPLDELPTQLNENAFEAVLADIDALCSDIKEFAASTIEGSTSATEDISPICATVAVILRALVPFESLLRCPVAVCVYRKTHACAGGATGQVNAARRQNVL
eukprot:2574983-Pleurochrysis_carterae.AAC.3